MGNVIEFKGGKASTLRECIEQLLENITDDVLDSPTDVIVLMALPTDKVVPPIVTQVTGRDGVDQLTIMGLLALGNHVMTQALLLSTWEE